MGLRAEDDIYVESVRKLWVASQWHRLLSRHLRRGMDMSESWWPSTMHFKVGRDACFVGVARITVRCFVLREERGPNPTLNVTCPLRFSRIILYAMPCGARPKCLQLKNLPKPPTSLSSVNVRLLSSKTCRLQN